jgi:hypothetical protein
MPTPKETFRNANVPHSVIKGKGKIEKINFKEHQEEVKRIWEGKPPAKLEERWKKEGYRGNQEKYYNPSSILSRLNKIKKLVGYSGNLVGYCPKCRNLNTHLVKYRTQGITIVECYCSEHVPGKI